MSTCKASYVKTVTKESDIPEIADLFFNGQILLLKLGTLYALTFNPAIEGLDHKLDKIKGRRSNQHFTLICNYDQALEILDADRINKDFYNIGESFSSKALLRIPLKATDTLPFPYNKEQNTVQYVSIEGIHPLLKTLSLELSRRSSRYMSTTSGNLHGEPICQFLSEAEVLAAKCETRIQELGISDTKVFVVDIPDLEAEYKGSFPIVSFVNPEQIEVIRNIENNLELTQRFIQKELQGLQVETSVAYTATNRA